MKVPERDFLSRQNFAPHYQSEDDLSFLPNPLPQSLPFSYRESILTFLENTLLEYWRDFPLYPQRENSHPAPQRKASPSDCRNMGITILPPLKRSFPVTRTFSCNIIKVKKIVPDHVYIRVYVKIITTTKQHLPSLTCGALQTTFGLSHPSPTLTLTLRPSKKCSILGRRQSTSSSRKIRTLNFKRTAATKSKTSSTNPQSFMKVSSSGVCFQDSLGHGISFLSSMLPSNRRKGKKRKD